MDPFKVISVLSILFSATMAQALPINDNCKATETKAYVQKILDQSILETAENKRRILIQGLMKIRNICNTSNQDPGRLEEKFKYKVWQRVQAALDIESQTSQAANSRLPGAISHLSEGLLKVRDLSDKYLQSRIDDCATENLGFNSYSVLSGAHLYKNPSEKYDDSMGRLNEGADLILVSPHIIRSFHKGEELYGIVEVKVLSDRDQFNRQSQLVGKTGYISVNEINYSVDRCL